ncbi:hypothetical protein E4U11_001918 [Claviceps purpurea]|nr:hypothetical protein E4U11_001918 [Claviceps purpurea]
MGPEDRYRYPEGALCYLQQTGDVSDVRLLPPTGSVAEIGERANRVKPDFPPRAGLQAIEAPTSKLEQISSLFDWAVDKLPWDLVTPDIVNSGRPVPIPVSVVTSRYDTPTELPVAASLAPLKIGAVGHGPARIDDIGGNEIPRQFVDGPVE